MQHASQPAFNRETVLIRLGKQVHFSVGCSSFVGIVWSSATGFSGLNYKLAVIRHAFHYLEICCTYLFYTYSCFSQLVALYYLKKCQKI